MYSTSADTLSVDPAITGSTPEPVPPNSAGQEDGLEHYRFVLRHDLRKRLDLYLRDRLTAYSRAWLQKLIKAQQTRVNGRPARASTILRAGDVVELDCPPLARRQAAPEAMPLDILYEDDDFLALNKPAGVIVHPARGRWSGTLINGLIYHARHTGGTLATGSDPWRPGIIHRLDRDTTGLLLIAKTDEAHWRLAGQFERRSIQKTYLALVHGTPPLECDLIDAPLGVHRREREKYAVRRDSGRPAQTVYAVRRRFAHFSWLELHPRTGRTHQLRVHLSSIGCPIAGDVTYGGRVLTARDLGVPADESNRPLLQRQALHAWKLQFVHPRTLRRMELQAPLPEDIRNLLALLESPS